MQAVLTQDHAASVGLGARLIYTSVMFLLAMAVDPTDSGLGLPLTFQFLPALIAIFGGAAYLAQGFRPVGGIIWQDIAFAVLITMITLGGASTSYVTGDTADSFLRLALSALSYIPIRMMASVPEDLDWFMRKLTWPVIVIGLLMSAQLFYWQIVGPFLTQRSGINHIFHEEVFLIGLATIVAAIGLVDRPILRVTIMATLILGQFFTFKITGFLTAFATIGILLLIPIHWVSQTPNRSVVLRFLNIIYALIGVGVFLTCLPMFVDHLPSGSRSVRLYTYAIRWQEFLDAPVFGAMFRGSPLVSVQRQNLIIPSHSDLLDLLAFGGTVGMLALALPVLTFVFSIFHLRHMTSERLVALFGYSLVVMLVIVMAFNPVWLQPKMGGFLWMGFAVMAGVLSRSSFNMRSVAP